MNRSFGLIALFLTAFAIVGGCKVMAQETYSNPVIRHDCADPTVLDDRERTGYFYVYSTQTLYGDTVVNLPVYRSKDLVDWEFVADGFSAGRPAWVKDSKIWAPDINYINGKYVLYYALGVWAKIFREGSGVAIADRPEGPFTDNGMVVSFWSQGTGNAIDPNYFDDGHSKYLQWGSLGPTSGIWQRRLNDDGFSVSSSSRKRHLGAINMEGAYLHKHGDYYYLFASKGTCCAGAESTYRIVVGRSRHVTGPYRSPDGKKMRRLGYDHVIMSGGADKTFVGPGHDAEIVTDALGQDWMLYHSWWKGNAFEGRCLNLDRIYWTEDGWPYFEHGEPSKTSPKPVFN